MIDADGWLSWAIRLQPSPADKNTNAGVSSARGIFMHSAEGYAGALLDPKSQWGYNGNHSWHLTNLMDGRVFQHYPFTARCHHATAANQEYIGVENEGYSPREKSLNEAQIANAVRFIREISEWRGWRPSRPSSPSDTSHTLWEHREVVRLGGTASSCPSGRIPWREIMSRLEGGLEDDMYTPHVAIAEWFEKRALPPTPDGQFWTMQAHTDFGLPEAARGKDLQLAVYMDSGVLRLFHGSTAAEAGAAGERGVNYVQLRGKVDPAGTLNFRAEGPVNIARVVCLGYYG